MFEAYQATLNAESLLNNEGASMLHLFTNSPSQATFVSTTPFASIASAPPPAMSSTTVRRSKPVTSFSGQCFNCQQYGHRSQDCPQKKTTLIAEEVPEDEVDEIQDKTACCPIFELD